jgi:hypothetical protein
LEYSMGSEPSKWPRADSKNRQNCAHQGFAFMGGHILVHTMP